MSDIEKHNENIGLQKFPNFVIFKTSDGKVNIDVFFKDETLWLTQKLIAELFEKGRTTITEHLKKTFIDGELEEDVVCRNFRRTTQHGAIEGKTQERDVKYYNLKAIIAVGYRVNSHRAIEFRKWATEILHEYIIKGFAMDDERLNLINSQIDLFRSQTTLNKGNARFPILYVTMATSASRKPALTFILCILTSHYEKLMNYSG